MELAVSSSPEALAQLRGPWQQLFDACPQAPVFLSWEWLSRWWTHFGGEQQLHVVTLQDDGQLVALAPLMVREPETNPQLRFIGREETTDYADLLALPGVRPGAVAAVGVTGAMHALVPVAADGAVLAPTLTWFDQRCRSQAEALRERWAWAFEAVGGVSLHASSARLRWLR